MCFMTKCPYVPPHEFNIDFPHLMLRYRMYQRKENQLPKIPIQLTKIDRNSKIAIIFHKIINWLSNVKNIFFRTIIEFFTGIDKNVILPKYNNQTFDKYSKKNVDEINTSAPAFGRKAVIYSTCFVNFNKKNTGIAALKVLKKNGVDVKHSYTGCCGMPHLEQGNLKEVTTQAKNISKELLKWVDKGYEIITLTASCGLMVKFDWPLLLPNDLNIKKMVYFCFFQLLLELRPYSNQLHIYLERKDLLH